MAYKRSDSVIYSILKFSEGYLKKIKIDSVTFAVPSTRVEHVKIKTRNKIAAGKKQPLWYLMCYFDLTDPPPQKKKKLIEMCLWGRNTYLNIYKTCFVYSREQQLALRR